jgi:hypothetical protein
MLATCRSSNLRWDHYLKDREAKTIITKLDSLKGTLWVMYRIEVAVVEVDNEFVRTKKIKEWFESHHITIEPSAPRTQAQNGGAERSGGVVKAKARAMRERAHLPEQLWPHIIGAAVYLLNRTPTRIHKWISPLECFHTELARLRGTPRIRRKPNQAHLKVYGCKAFAMTKQAQLNEKRLERFKPKAWIGYLVGYQSSNIYKVWNPLTNQVVMTRDVIFNEEQTFPGILPQLKDELRKVDLEVLKDLLQRISL